jgi:putative glycerol-1-phosphate prenyltransferase
MKTLQRLLDIRSRRGAGYLVLIDPDKVEMPHLPTLVEQATEAGADAFLIGGSLMVRDQFESVLKLVKNSTSLPVIIFPGSLFQVSSIADAILFLVLVSGRNPDHLIGNQVIASPMIRSMHLEAISTAYMLVEGGVTTSAEFMSGTRPLPHNKPDIAVAHALAAEYMGMKLLYFDAGSGAERPVSDAIIRSVARASTLPIVIGGGIRTPEEAHKKVLAGASFVVTGTIIEERGNHSMLKEFADAVHTGISVKNTAT